METKKIKRRIKILFSMLIAIVITVGLVVHNEIKKIDAYSEDYREKLIRFHVLANSDAEEDQELKLKVRDTVISYLQPKLESSKSIEQSEEIIKSENDKIKEISENIIKESGYNYSVSVNLEYSNFPAKQYSSVVLPAGKYKALRIVIGEGKGKNWWCVMFPPLCFVDEQSGMIDEKTDKQLKSVLTEEEYDLIMGKDEEEVNNIKFKFRIIEVLQNIL